MPEKNPMDWRPKRPGSAEEILSRLKELSPSVAFDVHLEPDPDHMWDGDGPDPVEEGYVAFNADVTVSVIAAGETLTITESLGGHYQKPDEEDLDIGGYLPQMLEEAAGTLSLNKNLPKHLLEELGKAGMYLNKVLKDRYERQQRRGDVDRGGG